MIIGLASCKNSRTNQEEEETIKLDPSFEAITTPVHVYASDGETYACFFENNYVKLTAYKASINKYAWYKIDNNNEILLSDSANYTTSDEGLYKLDIEDEIPFYGTLDTSVYISLGYCSTFIDFPDAFTPEMQTNSEWKPIYEGVRKVYLRIENENDVVLFETEELDEGWDGTFEDDLLTAGTYYYYLSGSYKSGYLFEKEGTLELSK